MENNPSEVSVSSLQVLFLEAWRGFTWELKRWLVPHIVAGMGLFLLMCYITTHTLFPGNVSGWKGWGVACLFLLYALGAFGYSLFTAGVFALRAACKSWNDFIDSVLLLLQEKMAHQLAVYSADLTKPQARHLVKGEVRNLFFSLKRKSVVPQWFLYVGLGVLLSIVRWVVNAKISKWSGRTIQFSRLFAGRATLVGAIFLNLHFFSTLLLYACYALGGVILILNIYFVFLVK